MTGGVHLAATEGGEWAIASVVVMSRRGRERWNGPARGWACCLGPVGLAGHPAGARGGGLAAGAGADQAAGLGRLGATGQNGLFLFLGVSLLHLGFYVCIFVCQANTNP